MRSRPLPSRISGALAILLVLAGCASSPPSRFYTLPPLSLQGEKPAAAAHPVSVSIAPVEIPDYLDHPQIVTRDGPNKLKLAEFDRWAGSLSDNMAAVLAENLGLLLGSDEVFTAPRLRSERADFSVAMRVLRLDCVPGEQVLFRAQWTLSGGMERKDVVTRVMTFTRRLGDKSFDTMVAAVGQILEQASREIAREIPAKPKGDAAR
ncbi:membrane integrity-associated transporter subunit PqiC [Geobacter sp. SVR]|uniref:PqiC family protein n=1 Tax=Geobacter sp. SVR TaxID=2495594 RepID=UPI00143F005A|nr:PqiC family protein [Geobacter sp. SVR]BCS52906.1 hypothetical protein GSVR_12140 [Geobacter sp. SVR]GCF87528.1 hypothetical protein GSbR_41280 [Geobacter sp. SVR]